MLPLEGVNQSINATIPTIPEIGNWIVSQPYVVLVIFIIAVLILYKLLSVALKGAVAATAGFIFPYAVNYFNLPIPVTADVQTAINFAIIAFALFMLYEFSHFIFAFFKILTWPVRVIIAKERYKTSIRKEVQSIEKRRNKT